MQTADHVENGHNVDPTPIPPLPFEGARIQRERITKQDIDGCSAIKDNKKSTGTLRSLQNAMSKNASELLRMEQKGWIEEIR